MSINGEAVNPSAEKSYVHVTRQRQKGDVVELHLPMLVRRVVSHEAVKENTGRVAVERGPIVYCAEVVDNGGHALELELADSEVLKQNSSPIYSVVLQRLEVKTSNSFPTMLGRIAAKGK